MEAAVGRKQNISPSRSALPLASAPTAPRIARYRLQPRDRGDDAAGSSHRRPVNTNSPCWEELACGKQSNKFRLRPKAGPPPPPPHPCPVRTLFETRRCCPPLLSLQRTRMWRPCSVASSNFTWPALLASLSSFTMERVCPRFAVRRRSDGPRTNEDGYATVLKLSFQRARTQGRRHRSDGPHS
ncbi:hypothetical protein PMIN01_01627 [Paraphaeosphaeria minitans]|uniref:Uncharacterized protein n=1 Tax=Paraphaeosphaeria minitans TaxID=565426 RepID=A0A9P6GP72_9PLEO|nr:hypothetical protein PMIN01_01627 [Paraphaeosphaeria minitans]